MATTTGRAIRMTGWPARLDPFHHYRSFAVHSPSHRLRRARLRSQRFDTPGGLEKVGNNSVARHGRTAARAANSHIAAGFVEGSNVNAVTELTDMIEISRSCTADCEHDHQAG